MAKRVCCCCGREINVPILFGKSEGFEMSNPGHVSKNPFICRECAAELGMKNKYSIGIKSVKAIVKKYAELHPEKKEMLKQNYENGFTWSEYWLDFGNLIKQAAQKEIKEVKEEARKKSGYDEEMNEDERIDCMQMTDEQLQEEMKSFIVQEPGMILQEGEICYFSVSCNSVRFKNVVVGASRTSNYFGMGSKRLYSGRGMSYKMNDRQNVAEKYPGNFHVTNKRMVCAAVKLSFEIPLTKITAMTSYTDGLSVMSGGKEYIVEFEGIRRFKHFLTISNEIERRRVNVKPIEYKNVTTVNSVPDRDIPKLLREYKALYDEGVITEEEFKNKKTQLLSGDN